MSDFFSQRPLIEPLEARIAPAGVLTANWKSATFGAPIELNAGDGLSTGGANSGTYLLYVEKGNALVFLTDLNNNGNVDFNEVTGIAAGDGLRLTSFVDIHGDIATNLVQLTATIGGVTTIKLSLTDSDSNRTNDTRQLGDGRILANSTIEAITLRSLQLEDISDQNNDGLVNDADLAVRKAYGTYSIFGDIIAGRGFGVAGGGLTIDTTNTSGIAENFGFPVPPSIGSIRVGTAASDHFFSYGASNGDDFNGTFVDFSIPNGQAGGDIIGVRSVGDERFNLDGLFAGNGGLGARGGNISDITIPGDDTGGYEVIAGNGGRGSNGGAGGSILNFTDLGSQTGNVIVRTGSGGPASSGNGGNAGSFSIGTFNVYGNIAIQLGSGGDGFLAGGNGAALVKGIFSQPATTIYQPGNAVGTMHVPGEIGTTEGIDFDGDGFGDLVFTSKITNSLVVQLGNGSGGVRTVTLPDGSTALDRVYLSGARSAEALTVGDFNADGLPDVAAASRDRGSQAGIVVFINKGSEDRNNNDVLDPGEDLDNDGAIDFLGFETARYSNLAQLDLGDPGTLNAVFPFWQGPAQISALTTGDYNGDGVVEIAALVTHYAFKVTDLDSGLTTGLTRAGQTLVFLQPDTEFNNSTGQDEFTGQFYMDFGTRLQVVNGQTVQAAPKRPFELIFGYSAQFDIGGEFANYSKGDLESSALDDSFGHDVVFVGMRGQDQFRFVEVYSYVDTDAIPVPGAAGIPVPPLLEGTYSFGRVDTNRDLGAAGSTDKTALANYTLRDFTVLDFNSDGRADLAVISESPSLFLTGIRGIDPGPNPPLFPELGAVDSGTADNAGNFFGDKGFDLNAADLMAVRVVEGQGLGNTVFDDLAILDSTGDWVIAHYRSGPQPTDAAATPLTGVQVLRPIIAGTAFVADAGEEFFADTFVPRLSVPTVMSVFVSSFDTARPNRNAVYTDPVIPGAILSVGPPLVINGFSTFAMVERSFRLEGGDGGDALVGKGGVGGLVGSGSRLSTLIDPLTGLSFTDLVGSVQINVSGVARIFAGDGGSGFTTGGKGGTISGVVVRPPLDPNDPNDPNDPDFGNVGINGSLVAGDGGRGVSGSGGAGGDLTQNSVTGGATFLAGDGGTGRIGGKGGDILGNGSSIFDAQTLRLRATAGQGADGVRAGGAGGSIVNFSPTVGSPSLDFGNFLFYTAGNGGDAVAGTGGKGGSISNSSPRPGDGINGEIGLTAGNGGDGLTGGNGGSIAKFISTPATNSKRPAFLSVQGGNGGDGLSGVGGNGGNLSAIDIPTSGGAFPSRLLGGNGGDSSGTRGGNGGNVTNINSGSTEGSFAVVGGAGGNGLWSGGHGGSVSRVDLFLPASASSKALIVGGEGGNAGSFIANPNDNAANQAQRAFGGRIGVGGNGGSIIDLTQSGNIGSHFDLVAGNGGDTLNYGSLRDTKAFVGKGGAISRVKISGDIGNLQVDDPNTPGVNENIPIKSYNDILFGETMGDWVDANLRGPVATVILDDAAGNVGIVVGAAGRNKAVVTDAGQPNKYVSLPANGTVNGNLVDIEARNILSAVAGNVDLIARIQIAQNIRVLGGVIGGDKPQPGTGVLGTSDYLDVNGVLTADGKPVLDGRLSDGALIARSVLGASGKPVTLAGRVFNL